MSANEADKTRTQHMDQFLELYSKVMVFADEATLTDMKEMPDWERHLRTEFANAIYVPRTLQESQLIRHICEDRRALSVEGVGGSGKSTLLRHLLSTVDAKEFPRVVLVTCPR